MEQSQNTGLTRNWTWDHRGDRHALARHSASPSQPQIAELYHTRVSLKYYNRTEESLKAISPLQNTCTPLLKDQHMGPYSLETAVPGSGNRMAWTVPLGYETVIISLLHSWKPLFPDIVLHNAFVKRNQQQPSNKGGSLVPLSLLIYSERHLQSSFPCRWSQIDAFRMMKHTLPFYKINKNKANINII
jgi:hypothetical protein